MTHPLCIGTRGSALARAQATLVERLLAPLYSLETVVIQTTGDRVTDKPLRDVGGKALFTKEIETALLQGEIDLAVHSMKDVERVETSPLIFPCFLPREDPRDALISRTGGGLEDLPSGALVGTSSLRRQAQLLAVRPDLRTTPLRGNVDTRLTSLEDGRGGMDAIILASAGLARLGLTERVTAFLPSEAFVPCGGQGVVGIQCRSEDVELTRALQALTDLQATRVFLLERLFLDHLQGTCHTPVGVWVQTLDDQIDAHCFAGMPDGSDVLYKTFKGSEEEARLFLNDTATVMRAWLQARAVL